MHKIWFDEAWIDYIYWQTQDKKTLKRGTGGILCLSDKFTAFDRDNLVIPVWEI